MIPSKSDIQEFERRLRRQAAACMPRFDESLHQRLMRRVAATRMQPVSRLRISRWRGPLAALALAAALMLGFTVAPALFKTRVAGGLQQGYSVEISAGNLLRLLPRMPSASVAIDRQLIDQHLASALSRASRVARNVIETSPIQFAIARPPENPSRQN